MDPTGEEQFWIETFQEQLAYLPASAHLCQVYHTPGEQLHALVPFCREGIRQKHQCVCLLPEPGGQDLLRSLRAAGMRRVTQAVERGDLVLITSREVYVRDGRFSPEAMRDFLNERAALARRDQFAGLRVAGQMDWILQLDSDVNTSIWFEGPVLNEFVAQTGSRVLCQFDRSRFRAEVIQGMLRTHPQIVLGARVVNNLYVEPGGLVLEEGQASVERRVDWMLTQLHEKTRRDMAVSDLERWALRGASPTNLLQAATHLVAQELKADLAESFELLPLDHKLRLVAEVGWRVPPIDEAQLGSNLARVFADLVQPGHPLIVTDWPSETRLKRPPALAAEAINSSVVVAISTLRDEHRYGLLGVHFKPSRTFSVQEIALLEKVAAGLAYAISRARADEQLRMLVEHVPDTIARFDAELRLIYANPVLEAVAETPADALKGKTMREVGLPESLVVPWELLLKRAWRAGRNETIEFTLETRQGPRYFQGTIVPELAPQGEVLSVMLIAHDLTPQRRAEADRTKLFEEVLVQQGQLQDLVSRLGEDHQHDLQRLGQAFRAESLTERERQILELLTRGWTNREIGTELGLTAGTVKNHVARILDKLDVSDRTQAAVRAVELGMTRTTS